MSPSPRWRPPATLLVCAAVGVAVAAGCSDDPDNSSPEPSADAHTDPTDDDASAPPPTWTHGVIGAGDVGRMPELGVSEAGQVGVAFFASSPVDGGVCDEIESDSPPNKSFWTLYYATQGADAAADDWQTEEVADLLNLSTPRGLDFGFSPDAAATIAAITGEPVAEPAYCGANDAGLLTRNGPGDWTQQTAVATSGEAATGEPASDFGDVVGYWPALGFDAAGQAYLAYKDVHSGAIQSDDRTRADLELAHKAGGWSTRPVDVGRGAGDYNTVAVDSTDRPVLAYINPVEGRTARLGVWAARPAADDDSFEKVQLFDKSTADGPSLVISADDDLPRVLFYNSDEGYPQLATQVAEDQFESIGSGWDLSDIGDARFDEGYDASLAVGPDGHLAAAYYRCAKVTDGLGNCTPTDDALIFAWEDAGQWTREVVDAGDEALCGRHPSLGFDADGFAHIAYECNTLPDGQQQTRSQVKYARRRPLF